MPQLSASQAAPHTSDAAVNDYEEDDVVSEPDSPLQPTATPYIEEAASPTEDDSPPQSPANVHLPSSLGIDRLVPETDWYSLLESDNYPTAITEEAYRLEKGNTLKTGDVPNSEFFWDNGRKIVCSIDKNIVKFLARGNLSLAVVNRERLHHNSMVTISSCLTKMKFERNCSLTPSAHLNELVRKSDSQATTPEEVEEAFATMEKYFNLTRRSGNLRPADANFIQDIDNCFSTKKITSDEDALWGRGFFKKTDSSFQTMKIAFNRRLQSANLSVDDKKRPMVQPFREVGYAGNSFKRIQAHLRATSGGNRLLAFFTHVLQYLYPNRFGLTQWIICQTWLPTMGVLSEVVLSNLCSSYTETGFGFNDHRAGLSNYSSVKADAKFNWGAAAKLVLNASGYVQNFTLDNDMLKAKADLINRKKQLTQALERIKVEHNVDGKGTGDGLEEPRGGAEELSLHLYSLHRFQTQLEKAEEKKANTEDSAPQTQVSRVPETQLDEQTQVDLSQQSQARSIQQQPSQQQSTRQQIHQGRLTQEWRDGSLQVQSHGSHTPSSRPPTVRIPVRSTLAAAGIESPAPGGMHPAVRLALTTAGIIPEFASDSLTRKRLRTSPPEILGASEQVKDAAMNMEGDRRGGNWIVPKASPEIPEAGGNNEAGNDDVSSEA